MLKIEEKIIKWIEGRIWIFAFIAVSVIGILVRFVLRDIQSPDYVGFLSNWYEEIKNAASTNALRYQVGNYSMPYQTLILMLTHFSLDSLYAYKLVSSFFDFGLAILVAVLACQMTTHNKLQSACIAYALTLLSPIVVLNSAAWAQCDALYVFFCIASIMALIHDKYFVTFFLYGVALAFKLQAIFLFPFFVVVYCIKKRFSILYFLNIILAMILCNLPNLLVGRNIKEIYWIYKKQAKQYYFMHMNYPSFWAVMNKTGVVPEYNAYKWMAILLTIAILGSLVVMIWRSKIELNHRNTLSIAFLLVYTCVLFLPAMHERYGFCYEVLAIIIVFFNKKTLLPFIFLLFLSCSTYGHYLFQTEINLSFLGAINTVVYIVYCYLLWKDAKMNTLEKRNSDYQLSEK